jgi:hypothetical protein
MFQRGRYTTNQKLYNNINLLGQSFNHHYTGAARYFSHNGDDIGDQVVGCGVTVFSSALQFAMAAMACTRRFTYSSSNHIIYSYVDYVPY